MLGKARWCGSWRLYDVDGSSLPHDECPMAVALKEARAVRGLQTVLQRPDGRKVAVMPYPTPLRDGAGRVIAGSNILLELDRAYRGICNSAASNVFAPSRSA